MFHKLFILFLLYMTNQSNISTMIMAFLGLGFGGYLYSRYQDKKAIQQMFESKEDVIRKVFINETQVKKTNKPILWIHIPYEKNARIWENFYSRMTDNLNLPFMYLTIKSIIDNNVWDFHVCLIDDDSFTKLLPKWQVPMNNLEETALSKYRKLGLIKLVYEYGGFVVEPSFLCFKSLIGFMKSMNKSGKPFFFEELSPIENERNTLETIYSPSLNFFGSPKKHEILETIIYNIEITIKNDNTSEMDFQNAIKQIILKNIHSDNAYLLDCKFIGNKTNEHQNIDVDDFLNQSTQIELYKESYGINIPYKTMLKRHKYMWFVNENISNILDGNYMLAYYFNNVFSKLA